MAESVHFYLFKEARIRHVIIKIEITVAQAYTSDIL